MVFYFTATGNSLYAARQLDPNTMSIPQVMRCGCLRRFSDETIGVVYPIYGHRPPELVQSFLREVALDTPYLYIIPTYGRRYANAVDLVADICRASGKEPAYINCLLMADNYLPAFDMDEEIKLEKHVDEQLAAIKADIGARKHYIQPVTDADRQAHEQFLAYEQELPGKQLGGLVYATDKCIGCGVCTLRLHALPGLPGLCPRLHTKSDSAENPRAQSQRQVSKRARHPERHSVCE